MHAAEGIQVSLGNSAQQTPEGQQVPYFCQAPQITGEEMNAENEKRIHDFKYSSHYVL